MDPALPDRLAIMIVSGTQGDKLFMSLTKEKFTFTVINSTGGVIQEPVICLMVGFPVGRLPTLLEIVRKYCRPYRKYISARGFMQGETANVPMVEAELGGARFYLMNVERFAQI